jgi:class 3 adenylate cyclase
MDRQSIECTVMFADVVGSTSLYEKYGDEAAKSAIDGCIEFMLKIAEKYNGVLIKTIGDEIMCRFPDANLAVESACEINDTMVMPFGAQRLFLTVKIGLHHGEVILDGNDVFGDAVNVAARMAGISKSQQIITTQGTYNVLNASLQNKAREFDKTTLKGKSQPVTIYDIVWSSSDDRTSLVFATGNITQDSSLELIHNGTSVLLSKDDLPFVIGRSASSDMMVESSLASRTHIKIDYSRGKFVAADTSTNGTYVKLDNGKEVYLRREDMPMSSSGFISPGEKITGEETSLIAFKVS